MPNIILQPTSSQSSQEHFQDTVKNGVSIERIRPFIKNDVHLKR